MTTGDNTGDGTGGDTGGITPAVIALESVLATLREQLNVANGRAHRAEHARDYVQAMSKVVQDDLTAKLMAEREARARVETEQAAFWSRGRFARIAAAWRGRRE